MLLSIGIPTFNQPEFIVDAVKSALALSYPNKEIIVVEDDPYAQTKEMLEPFIRTGSIQFFQNPKNLGRVGNYRRILFELAKGDWFIMLDGDDYFVNKDWLEKAILLIEKDTDLMLCFGDYKVVSTKNSTTSGSRNFLKDGSILDGEKFLDAFLNNQIQPGHQTTIYKREMALGVNFYEHNILSTDLESLFKLALHGKVGYIHSTIAAWRKHGKNATTIKTLEENLANTYYPERVQAYATTLGIDLKNWSDRMRAKLFCTIVAESIKYRKSGLGKILRAVRKDPKIGLYCVEYAIRRMIQKAKGQ